jgi:hypothetical protein
MKFGKHLLSVVELSDPEWGPYWINYKFLKKIINDIVESAGDGKLADHPQASTLAILSKSPVERNFFSSLRKEVVKSSDFFSSTEPLYQLRYSRVHDGYVKLQQDGKMYDKNAWSRLLRACVKVCLLQLSFYPILFKLSPIAVV